MRKQILMVLVLVSVIACNDTKQNTDGVAAAMLALGAASSSTTGGTGNALISSISPTNGQVLTSSTTTVVVNFASAMNTSVTQGAFSVSDGTNTISGTFAWSNGNKTLTFTPGALTAYTVHTVSISSAAKTSAGGSFTAYSMNFRIGPFFQSAGKYWQGGNAASIHNGEANCTLASGQWRCTQAEAISYCAGLGMSLPTVTEVTNAYATDSANIFNPGALLDYYWTGTGGSSKNICRIAAGPALDCAATGNNTTDSYMLRCVL